MQWHLASPGPPGSRSWAQKRLSLCSLHHAPPEPPAPLIPPVLPSPFSEGPSLLNPHLFTVLVMLLLLLLVQLLLQSWSSYLMLLLLFLCATPEALEASASPIPAVTPAPSRLLLLLLFHPSDHNFRYYSKLKLTLSYPSLWNRQWILTWNKMKRKFVWIEYIFELCKVMSYEYGLPKRCC